MQEVCESVQTHLGLTPEEMISVFNDMYLDVWNKTREKVHWEAANISKQLAEGHDVDISELLLRLLEVVITAARDGAILTMYYNNEKVYEDLRSAGIEFPVAQQTPPEEA